VPSISLAGDRKVLTLVVVALVLGLINAFVRPILTLLSCGLIVLTLGLFLLVINALLLWFAGYISEHWLGLGFHVSSFGAAFLGALIVSVVSFIASLVLGPRRGRRRNAW
jgi:putative membrane protein